MGIFEFLTGQFEGRREKNVGKIECSRGELPDVLIGMLQKMGMNNPSKLTVKSTKGVTVIKKGNKYVLVLNTYNPPLVLSWTGTIPLSQLLEVIDNVAKEGKKIGFINFVNVEGTSTFQLGLA